MKILPIWAQAAIAAAVIAVIFGAGFQTSTWKWSGRVEKAVAAQAKAEKEAREKVALEAQWRADVKVIREEMEQFAVAHAALQRAYDEAVNQPPDVVIEYRDRWHTVTETIVSHDCLEGVTQLFTFIQNLPERPQ